MLIGTAESESFVFLLTFRKNFGNSLVMVGASHTSPRIYAKGPVTPLTRVLQILA
jgi:hypothetical protein